MKQTSVIFKNPYQIELIQSPLPAPDREEVLVKTRISAISAGTEILIYRGQFPPTLSVDTAIPALARPFAYPLAYGYASVGQVIDIGPSAKKELMGRSVFCLHPHESHYVIRQDQLIPLPDDIEPDDAVFLATMESAVNFLMDGRPVIGENVVVFGLGVVGLLTTALLSRLPLARVVALDPYALRRKKGKMAGADTVLDPADSDLFNKGIPHLQSTGESDDADLVYELSGNPATLNQALSICGPGSRIVIGSWYGTKRAELDLGGSFHRNRVRIISSQVSTLGSRFSTRWTKTRRMRVALDMIRQLNPGRFITHRYDIQQAAAAYDLLDKRPQQAIQVVLTYSQDSL